MEASKPNAIKDARGSTLHVGDTVIYFKSGRYSSMQTAVIKEVRTMVKLTDIDRLSTGKKFEPSEGFVWAAGSSVVKVDALPHMPHRLNTTTSHKGALPTGPNEYAPEFAE